MNVRRLIASFVHELRMLRLAGAMLKTDDARYAEDTALLTEVRQIYAVPSECPLPDCQTCEPYVPAWLTGPTGTPGFANHLWPAAATTDAVIHWLRCAWPEAWWATDRPTLEATAERLLLVRMRAALREIVP